MNCKPNDLAFVIKPLRLELSDGRVVVTRPDGLGRVVRVLRLTEDGGAPCWVIEEPFDVVPYYADTGARVRRMRPDLNGWLESLTILGIEDDNLRPLPSEGEVGEHDERQAIYGPGFTEEALAFLREQARRLAREATEGT